MDSAGGISLSLFASHAVHVSQPTGAAIQAAINAMGPSGGSIYLTATQPYISQTIVINKNNIKLIGRGPRATKLVAKSGAVLTAPGHNTVHGFGAGVALGSDSKGCEVENNNLRSNTACVTNDGMDNHVSNNLC